LFRKDVILLAIIAIVVIVVVIVDVVAVVFFWLQEGEADAEIEVQACRTCVIGHEHIIRAQDYAA
jgi:hypothetical protein